MAGNQGGERAMQSDSLMLVLQAQSESLPTLREHLEEWLQQAGASDAETFDMVLAGAEAFSNAVEHPVKPTSPLVEVQGTITGEAVVTVTVRDYGQWADEHPNEEQTGMGLAIVEAVTDSFRVDFSDDGTTLTMQRKLGWPDDRPPRLRP